MNKINKIYYLILLIITFISGIIFFSLKKEWVILNVPKYQENLLEKNKQKNYITTKKTINLFYWHGNKWNKENTEILWSNNKIDNINKIINNWLNLVDEEKIIDKKVTLQNTLLSFDNQEIYISFDRNLLSSESSTYDKLMLIESLLKTLRDNNIENYKIYFLVNHAQMQDTHLDFTHAWPINGFIS
jgi:hypothetical protein